MSNPRQTISIQQTENWAELEQKLHDIRLVGDPTQKPYEHAQIQLKEVTETDVFPVSRYILSNHLDTQRLLHWAFEQEHGINTLNQETDRERVVFKLEGETEEWSLIPPIVEESELDGKPLLIDGEHRFFLAKELGVPINVIWISQVPEKYPIVATPISWSELKEYPQVPELKNKREYRYATLQDFPDISRFSSVNVTAENFLYFFYRDLSPVCTSGVRRVGST